MVTCLVTGNLEPIGWGKMRALGLQPLFTPPPFGGFGSDFCSGNHQVLAAEIALIGGQVLRCALDLRWLA